MHRKGLMDFCVKGEKEEAGWEKRIANRVENNGWRAGNITGMMMHIEYSR